MTERDRPVPRDQGRRDTQREQGLRGLVGSGPSRVGVQGAMRARDVARPRAEDIEEAERTVVIKPRPASRPQGSAGGSPDRS